MIKRVVFPANIILFIILILGTEYLTAVQGQGQFQAPKDKAPNFIPDGGRDLAPRHLPNDEQEQPDGGEGQAPDSVPNDDQGPDQQGDQGGGGDQGDGGGGSTGGTGGGGCLIATAAFGSELSPQVQFLRNFRDVNILSTSAGSSFMNVFNAWYYSFSPHVAEYERQQPWFQQIVRITLYPLLGSLYLSEKAYSSIGGEYGALNAGLVASFFIGAIYFSPLALLFKQVRKGSLNSRIVFSVALLSFVAVLISIVVDNQIAMMITTSLFVITMITVSAILSARLMMKLKQKILDMI